MSGVMGVINNCVKSSTFTQFVFNSIKTSSCELLIMFFVRGHILLRIFPRDKDFITYYCEVIFSKSCFDYLLKTYDRSDEHLSQAFNNSD